MPRQARLVVPGVAHHVTQRGNNLQQVFFTDEDREVYLDRLFRYCDEYEARVLAYCLMPNHVHVVAIPVEPTSLCRVFGRLHSDYALYANLKRRASGHLWQERYYSSAMDEGHTICAIAYVERNPLRAQMMARADDYAWSSARAHLRGEDEGGRLQLYPWARWYTSDRWREVLDLGVEEEAWLARFREAARRGLPMGEPEWIDDLEKECGRDLSFRTPGRPRRTGEKTERLVAVG